jgi:hypothetical protein
VRVYLGLVGSYPELQSQLGVSPFILRENSRITCAHDPIPIFADPDALACLLKLEVLQQFNPVRILWIVL